MTEDLSEPLEPSSRPPLVASADVRASSVSPLFDVYGKQIHSLFRFTFPTAGASGVTGVVQVGLRVSQLVFSSESL